jgi:hypothetical protein
MGTKSNQTDDLPVLTAVEAARINPGMYIGGTGQQALHHVAWYLIGHALDESALRSGNRLSVTIEPGGVIRVADDDGKPSSVFYLDRYALLIQMLSYTAWHLGKPLPEPWGTIIWGLAAGAMAYTIRSIWPIVLAHWLLNVVLDASIVISLGLILH